MWCGAGRGVSGRGDVSGGLGGGWASLSAVGRCRAVVGGVVLVATVGKLVLASRTFGSEDVARWRDYARGVADAGPVGVYRLHFRAVPLFPSPSPSSSPSFLVVQPSAAGRVHAVGGECCDAAWGLVSACDQDSGDRSRRGDVLSCAGAAAGAAVASGGCCRREFGRTEPDPLGDLGLSRQYRPGLRHAFAAWCVPACRPAGAGAGRSFDRDGGQCEDRAGGDRAGSAGIRDPRGKARRVAFRGFHGSLHRADLGAGRHAGLAALSPRRPGLRRNRPDPAGVSPNSHRSSATPVG